MWTYECGGETGADPVVISVAIDGPAAGTLGPVIGPEVTAEFPQVVAALIAEAEAATARP